MAELVDARDSKSRGAIHESSILSPGTRAGWLVTGSRKLLCDVRESKGFSLSSLRDRKAPGYVVDDSLPAQEPAHNRFKKRGVV